jgi:hypothetical protein
MLQHILNLSASTYYYTSTSSSTSTNVPSWFWPVYFGSGIILYLVTGFFLSKVFKKAGRPGWAAYVPLYNNWLLLEMGGQKGIVLLWNLLPFAGPLIYLVFSIKASLEIGRRFGKSNVFSVFGLILFSLIGYIILAFDKSIYHDPQNMEASGHNMSNPGAPAPFVGSSYESPTFAAQAPVPTVNPVQPLQHFEAVQPTQPVPPIQPIPPSYPSNEQQPPLPPTVPPTNPGV